MARTRVLTAGFRLYASLALFFFVATFVYGVSTELQVEGSTVREVIDSKGLIQSITGPITAGWKGGVGAHLGYAVLLVATAAAAALAGLLIAFRDADPEAEAEVLHVETVPRTRAPAGASYSPIIGVFGVVLAGLGWVTSSVVMWAGVAVIVITGLVWTVRAWAERATGDDEVNYLVYKRIIDPLRIPLVASVLIGFVVIAFSRVLLALPNVNASRVAFGGLAVVFFGVVVLLAWRPQVAKTVVTVLLVLGGLLLLGGMIYGIVEGPREGHGSGTEGHGGEGSGSAPAGGHEGSLGPIRVVVGSDA